MSLSSQIRSASVRRAVMRFFFQRGLQWPSGGQKKPLLSPLPRLNSMLLYGHQHPVITLTQAKIGTLTMHPPKWSSTTRDYQKIASITGGEADFIPVWTSRLLDYYPHHLGYLVTRFEYPRYRPRFKDGVLAVDSTGRQLERKSFPSVRSFSLTFHMLAVPHAGDQLPLFRIRLT